MQDTAAILTERGATHGNWYDNARISQQTKLLWQRQDGWSNLTVTQREALDMIAHKVGRILAGNPHFADHWADLSGYATLVVRELEECLS